MFWVRCLISLCIGAIIGKNAVNDERLVAFQVIANDNLHYITWDTDGVMVSNCLEGVEYGKEMLKNE